MRLFSACPDIARLIQIIDDIDALARGIRLVPGPDDAEPGAALLPGSPW